MSLSAIARFLARPFLNSGIGKIFPFNYAYQVYAYIVASEERQELIMTQHGFQMYIDSDGLNLEKSLRETGGWEPAETEIFKKYVPAGWVVVDLGANIGIFTLLSSQLVGAAGRVLAFEPSSRIGAILNKNIAVNNFTNIEVFPYGVWSKEASIDLMYDTNNPWASTVVKSRFTRFFKKETIVVKRLDDVIPSDVTIDFLKMDIEGYECEAVQGMLWVLRRTSVMLFEYSPVFYERLYGNRDQGILLLETIRWLGFTMVDLATWKRVEDFASFDQQFTQKYLQTNIVCTH